jgi:hypothetical protein
MDWSALPTIHSLRAGARTGKHVRATAFATGLTRQMALGRACREGEIAMYGSTDVPDAYRPFFFVNAGGPSRQILSREPVQKKWQLVTLDCGHRLLVPRYRKSAKVGCGFCGGLEPLSPAEAFHPG